jgi:hypothetical protein
VRVDLGAVAVDESFVSAYVSILYSRRVWYIGSRHCPSSLPARVARPHSTAGRSSVRSASGMRQRVRCALSGGCDGISVSGVSKRRRWWSIRRDEQMGDTRGDNAAAAAAAAAERGTAEEEEERNRLSNSSPAQTRVLHGVSAAHRPRKDSVHARNTELILGPRHVEARTIA